MESNWKDYFSFTKKERAGIVILLLLIGVTVAAPYFFSSPDIPDKTVLEAFAAQTAQLQKITSNDSAIAVDDHYRSYSTVKESTTHNTNTAVTTFPFDPNTISAAGWERLGLSSRIIHTIQNYLAKGGHFRKPADLQKIYGLKKQDCERLMPFVQIADTPARQPFKNNWSTKKYVKPAPAIIDINQADTGAFIALPGIGSKLASRIVAFRDRLGGFYSVQQIAEVYGLPDSTFQLIKPQLQCAVVEVKKININTADAATLKQHPYIKWNVANAIVQYRQQHGAYQSPQDLQQIAIITPELFQKLMIYISVQ